MTTHRGEWLVAEGHRRLLGVLVALVAFFGVTTLGGADDEGAYIASSSPTLVQATQSSSEVPVSTTQAEAVPPTTTTTTSAPVTTTRPPLEASVVTTSRSPVLPLILPTTTAPPPPPPTTTTTLVCRNSTDPACGPFRFDPQPGPDNPMSVHIVMDPPAPAAGQEVVFTITLTDPDGVSINGSTYIFGDTGLGESSVDPCTKFGPWDPPARDPAHATEIVTLRHTYAEARAYKATFYFTGFPFDCEDSVTGRGDRPYASSASGTVSFEVK